jgi:hypothetical protein
MFRYFNVCFIDLPCQNIENYNFVVLHGCGNWYFITREEHGGSSRTGL